MYDNMTMTQMVAEYNSLVEKATKLSVTAKPVTKFADRAVAVKRLERLNSSIAAATAGEAELKSRKGPKLLEDMLNAPFKKGTEMAKKATKKPAKVKAAKKPRAEGDGETKEANFIGARLGSKRAKLTDWMAEKGKVTAQEVVDYMWPGMTIAAAPIWGAMHGIELTLEASGAPYRLEKSARGTTAVYELIST